MLPIPALDTPHFCDTLPVASAGTDFPSHRLQNQLQPQRRAMVSEGVGGGGGWHVPFPGERPLMWTAGVTELRADMWTPRHQTALARTRRRLEFLFFVAINRKGHNPLPPAHGLSSLWLPELIIFYHPLLYTTLLWLTVMYVITNLSVYQNHPLRICFVFVVVVFF